RQHVGVAEDHPELNGALLLLQQSRLVAGRDQGLQCVLVGQRPALSSSHRSRTKRARAAG
ncbi:MAG: hypothetical protein M3385_04955, partial [Actinomycetota bacterium]|nr:hypothetical protein [Actinomycetota bacterium]